MNGIKYPSFIAAALLMASIPSGAQRAKSTAKSLFWKSDSLQVTEIISEKADEYKNVGHHGPAVENSHAAFRLYFNDSGAIDIYSKSGRGMELERYKWYPSKEQMKNEGAGCDEYLVGKTVGLGGIALWDGKNEVKLKATKGRTARVGDTKKGCFAEIISYGVEYKGDMVDISVRIDVAEKTRLATVTAQEISGKKVRFLSGVNYHPGENIYKASNGVGVWGVHPADVSDNPTPIGAAVFFDSRMFPDVEQTSDMLRIISKPGSSVSTTIMATSVKEAELNTVKRFKEYFDNNTTDPERIAAQKAADKAKQVRKKAEKKEKKAEKKIKKAEKAAKKAKKAEKKALKAIKETK